MLVLRVEYLTGVCLATKHDDPTRSVPEWPPHPDRLYSALIAAAAEPRPAAGTDLSASAREALEWLAGQGAPLLNASIAYRRTTPAVPMPSNPHEDEVWQKATKNRLRLPQRAFDLRTLLPVHRKKVLLPIPAVVPEEPAVYFIWPDAEPGGHRDTLRSICERVTYLGRSRSLVRVSVEEQAPPATHIPDPLGGVQLRVQPRKGRLAYLIDKHNRDGGKPEPAPLFRYRQVDTERSSLPSASPSSMFDRFWIFQPRRHDPALLVTATLRVTEALRRAVLKQVHDAVCGCDRWKDHIPAWRQAQDCYAKIPGTLSGHAENGSPLGTPHLAFVALPFVHPVQRHADGAIKGLGVLVPRDLHPDTSTLLARALLELMQQGLQIPAVGRWHVAEVPMDDPPLATLDSRTWTLPSRTWTTATPMVFGHFPKSKNGGEAKVVLDSLRLVGVDSSNVVEIAVGRHSPLHGAPPTWCYKSQPTRAETEAPQRWIRHVTIRFDQPVTGPLVLGPMRYFGLGLMRPLED